MSRSVRLSEEAYDRLTTLRREDETLSEVVVRLTTEESFLELAGVLSDEQADALEDAVEERRERRRDELEAVTDELRNA